MSDSAALLEMEPMARRARRDPDWRPELRKFSPERLRHAIKTRRRRGVALRVWEVASQAGVGERTLRNWSNGVTTPDANELLRLAAILRVEVLDLSDPDS